MTKKSKDITEIVDNEVIDEVMGEFLSTSKDKRQDKFLLLWLLGHSMKSAALASGYSESYASSGVQKAIKKSSKLKERMLEISSGFPERYRALCRLKLADVAEIEQGVLEEMKADPVLAAKHPKILRDLKITSGVLENDTPKTPTIQVDKMNLYSQIIHQNLEQASSGSPDLEFLDLIPQNIESDPGEE